MKPIAMILTAASIVKRMVKQLSRYPRKIIYSDSGFLKGLSTTSMIELTIMSVMIIPSNILTGVI